MHKQYCAHRLCEMLQVDYTQVHFLFSFILILTEEADFDGTVLEIIFPADENLSRSIFELPADIPVVDDEINEAGAQQFIVSLRVFSALNISLVKIEQNTSICNIIDDDSMSNIIQCCLAKYIIFKRTRLHCN